MFNNMFIAAELPAKKQKLHSGRRRKKEFDKVGNTGRGSENFIIYQTYYISFCFWGDGSPPLVWFQGMENWGQKGIDGRRLLQVEPSHLPIVDRGRWHCSPQAGGWAVLD